MVSLRAVRTANSSLRSRLPSPTALFVGGTSGIGRSTLLALARNNSLSKGLHRRPQCRQCGCGPLRTSTAQPSSHLHLHRNRRLAPPQRRCRLRDHCPAREVPRPPIPDSRRLISFQTKRDGRGQSITSSPSATTPACASSTISSLCSPTPTPPPPVSSASQAPASKAPLKLPISTSKTGYKVTLSPAPYIPSP